MSDHDERTIDPVQLLVMANRIDGITREMTNTLVRTARSTTLAVRDFSTSISDVNHQLFAAPEGIPCHVYGSGLLCETMAEYHPDFQEGDAFLHNDPYLGNSHPADHTILVPVFFEGEHVFTTCIKAHQADCGNALPTTYMPKAIDVYAEGALIFPCVKIQEDYQDVGDIVRMCQKRIRVPEIWYGDYLAMLAAGRVGEQRIKEFCQKYGLETVKRFQREWLDYSERMADAEIRKLPKGTVHGETALDPFPTLPDGVPMQVDIAVDPEAGFVHVDLTDNIDCTPAGINLSESTAINCGVTGVLSVLNSKPEARNVTVPNNAGAFRRIPVQVRENCVVGIPRHPSSCSMATNTVADRCLGMVYSSMSQLGDGIGLAEPCFGSGPYQGVVSGYNRKRDEPFVLQIFSGTAGGPAGPQSDGWLTFLIANAGGMAYFDETEVIEQKYPFVVWDSYVRIDSEGAGRQRGAPGNVCVYGPLPDQNAIEVHYSLDGMITPPKGVRGGGGALGNEVRLQGPDGSERHLPDMVGEQIVDSGERLISLSTGAGGYGDPKTRDPQAVLTDVAEGYVTPERARAIYGVALAGDASKVETLRIDEAATAALRSR